MLPDHEYHPLEVVAVVDETADTRSFVLGIPPALETTFNYAPGQFCTFRATVDGESVVRCYSMSSAPDVGDPFTTTVKRVDGGRMSNWMNDFFCAGIDDRVGGRPACSCSTTRRPIVAFAGGAASRRCSRHQERTCEDRPLDPWVYANRRRLGDSRTSSTLADRHDDRLESITTSTTSAASSMPRRARCSRRSARTPISTSAARLPTWIRSKPD
jgi:3-ketosteroid 9alpha-monooxygenase subunit B